MRKPLIAGNWKMNTTAKSAYSRRPKPSPRRPPATAPSTSWSARLASTLTAVRDAVAGGTVALRRPELLPREEWRLSPARSRRTC